MNADTVSGAIWRKRSRALEQAWPSLLEGDEDALHKARVASRRIREALPILLSGASGKVGKSRRQVRRITRALGPVRELDVSMAVLARLEAEHPALVRAVDELRTSVAADRADERARLIERLEDVDIRKLNQRVSDLIAGRDEHTPRPSGRSHPQPWRSVLGARVVRRAGALRAAVERAGAIYLPDRLHAVRVAVKKLRYSLELAREADRSRRRRDINILKGMQDTLGHLHDLEVLGGRARSLQGSLKPSNRSALAHLETLSRLIEDECRTVHARYVAKRAELVEVCDRAVTERRRALALAKPRPARVLSADGRPVPATRSTVADRPPDASSGPGE
jgi:CHAD domain-containing protein